MEKLLVSSESIDCEELRQLSWSGLSPRVRPKAWKILCGYLPGSVLRQKELLQRKQEEYAGYVRQYFHTKDQDVHQDTYRQIHIDIPRMSPVIGLFQQRCVQGWHYAETELLSLRMMFYAKVLREVSC